MATSSILITNAGLAEVVNAEQNGTAPVIITEVGYGKGQYTPTADMTSLKDEFKRLTTISGGAVGENIIHLMARDESTDDYTVYEVGLYTESGTLFAIYSQTAPIIHKSERSHALLAIDVVVSNMSADSIAFGDTNFMNPPATTETLGVVELATEEEVVAGEDTARAITPRAFMTTFSKEHGDSGFQKLPSGFLLQWGKAFVDPKGSTMIAFPAAFPKSCVSANAMPIGDIAADFSVSSMTRGNVAFKHTANGGVNTMWMAIGY